AKPLFARLRKDQHEGIDHVTKLGLLLPALGTRVQRLLPWLSLVAAQQLLEFTEVELEIDLVEPLLLGRAQALTLVFQVGLPVLKLAALRPQLGPTFGELILR